MYKIHTTKDTYYTERDEDLQYENSGFWKIANAFKLEKGVKTAVDELRINNKFLISIEKEGAKEYVGSMNFA